MAPEKKYKITIPHFYSLTYSEGDHTMMLEIDFRDKVPCLYFDLIKNWNPPHEKEEVSLQKREEIFNNIYKYLTEVRGFNIEKVR